MFKKNLYIFLICLCLVISWQMISFLLATHSIKKGIKNQDSVTLSSYVDFDGVRQSVKTQIKLGLQKNKEDDDSGFAAIGAMIGMKILDEYIDTYISSHGLASLDSNSSFNINEINGLSRPCRVRSLMEAHVCIESSSANAELQLVFRSNFMKWRLVDVIIPGKAFSENITSVSNSSIKRNNALSLKAEVGTQKNSVNRNEGIYSKDPRQSSGVPVSADDFLNNR